MNLQKRVGAQKTFGERMWAVIPMMAVIFLSSFAYAKVKDELSKRLGMVKVEMDKKISDSFFGGYMNTYGVSNLKHILSGDRVGVTKEMLTYTKNYIGSAEFAREYNALRDRYHPTLHKLETPEEMRANMISTYKRSVTETEEALKKADAGSKKMYEGILADARKFLKDAEDPDNKVVANYTANYPQLLQSNRASYEHCLQVWERKYPADAKQFVKHRLEKFLHETEEIDFSAELVNKGNKKVFADPKNENKSYYWKMAFRAGKEPVEAARSFVQQWIEELG